MTFDIQNGVLKKVYQCTSHVVIPSSVTRIDDRAFQFQTALQSVVIPDSVIKIERCAFSNCTALESVSLGLSVRKIDYAAFSGCCALKSVTLSPDHPHFFFKNDLVISRDGTINFALGSIVDAVIPDSVTTIGSHAFANCTLLQSVSIPNSVTQIDERAFADCPNLHTVAFSENHPHFLLKNDMILSKHGKLLFALGTIVDALIPSFVTSIENSAFCGRTALQSVSIPGSVTRIGHCAFECCSSLQSVIIPDSVTQIGNYAFIQCKNLLSVVLPDSVASIGFRAFYGCDKMQLIKMSSKHFKLNTGLSGFFNELFAPPDSAEILVCMAPLSDIPLKYYPKACIGFALHENEYPKELHKGYLGYIRTHTAEMCRAAIRHPESLRLLCREKLIDANSFPTLFNATAERGNVELTALLLEYKHTHLINGTSERDNDLSLNEQVHSSPSAAS